MGAGSFQSIITGFIMFTLFSFMMLSWISEVGDLNNVDTSEIGKGSLAPGAFNSTVIDTNDLAQNQLDLLSSGGVTDIDNPSGVLAILFHFWDFITTPFTLFSQILNNVLHVPAVVTNTVLTLLAIITLLAIWRVIRAGD